MQCKAKGQTFHLFMSFNPPLLYMALYLSFLVPPLALKHFEKSCTGFLKNYTRFHVKLYWVFIFSFLVQIPHPHIFWIAETTMGILFFYFFFWLWKIESFSSYISVDIFETCCCHPSVHVHILYKLPLLCISDMKGNNIFTN